MTMHILSIGIHMYVCQFDMDVEIIGGSVFRLLLHSIAETCLSSPAETCDSVSRMP